MSAPTIDHNVSLSIYQMVRNRLPFVLDNPTNQAMVSQFTLEVMNELEPCFQIDKDNTSSPFVSKIGHEENYSVLQQSIIADIVAVYIMMLTFIPSSESTSGGSVTNSTTFLKKAKAGSAEVEYDQFDSKIASGRLAQLLNVSSLIDYYRKSAIRKANQLGCIIDICDDCTTKVTGCGCDGPTHNGPFPFRVATGGACLPGSGTSTAERD